MSPWHGWQLLLILQLENILDKQYTIRNNIQYVICSYANLLGMQSIFSGGKLTVRERSHGNDGMHGIHHFMLRNEVFLLTNFNK